ncbi:SRR1-domain-containing protein [Mucidula mucida]|nr:SRR1-domain-containing protein [Mucidula mucida]
MPQQTSDDGFTQKQKRTKKRPTQPRPSLSEVVDRAQAELDREGWMAAATKIIRDSLDASSLLPLNILCLGLGSPEASATSRAQLSFLFQLCRSLNIDHSRVSVYDPVFSGADTSLLTERGMQIGPLIDYRCATPTIVYMPHCDMELHEHFLRANWTPSSLRSLILVCNRLGDYVDSHAAHKLVSRVPCLVRIVPFLQCHALPASSSCPAAFNNTSVQFVCPSQFDTCSSELMAHPVPPGSTATE